MTFGWNGPALASQQVHPFLISLSLERGLTVLRVALCWRLPASCSMPGGCAASIFGAHGKAAALFLVVIWAGAATPAVPKCPIRRCSKRSGSASSRRPTPIRAQPIFRLVLLTLNDRRIINRRGNPLPQPARRFLCLGICPPGRLSRCSLTASRMLPCVATTITFGSFLSGRRAPRACRGTVGGCRRMGMDLPAQAPSRER